MSDFAQQILDKLQTNIARVIVGKQEAVTRLFISLLCRGHVLIEDVPGVGKTTLAHALAKSLQCEFARIQFTPDLMPSDITGYSIVNFKTGDMEYRPGLVMSQIILADEINRTSPKTQSSLLEVMEEGQVSVDGHTYPLPKPFMVLATQNPLEFIGTYPLPEAQMDRFFMRISLGYPTIEEEMRILGKQGDPESEYVHRICTAEEIIALQDQVGYIYCAKELCSYIAEIVARTRESKNLQLGVSPRGTIYIMRAAQALAMLMGRDYVLPDDVQSVAQSVLAHRMVLTPEARLKGQTTEGILSAILRLPLSISQALRLRLPCSFWAARWPSRRIIPRRRCSCSRRSCPSAYSSMLCSAA